jgi:enoyl-CoA hydratase/carnithine racemase
MMPVRVERDGRGIVTVVIDREAKRNALDSETLAALADRVNMVTHDGGVRGIVLRGAGDRAFIGGADVVEMAAIGGAAEARMFITAVHRACDTLRRAPVPVIARITGHCLGAGLELAASCDLRVADETAVFAMPEVRIGLPSVVEAALLPRLIGWGRTKRLLLTGETIDADQALDWGLVEEVAVAGTIDAAINRLTQAIVTAGRDAVRLQKELMAEWERLPLAEAVQRGIDCFERAWRGPEPRQMLAAQLAAMQKP